jgi:methylglyoxal synthase
MKLKVLNSQTLSEFQELDLSLTIRMEGECLIGRSPNSGLVLDSPDVSRLHGKFFLQNGNYYYCDLGSRNGSLVNGRIAETNQKYVLKPGDIIRLGEFVLMLEEVTPPDLPETVVRVIDATVLSNSLRNQQIPPLPKQEEKVPEVAAQEVLDSKTPDSQQIGQQNTTKEPAPEAVDREEAAPVNSELTYVQIDEHTFIQPAQVANEISESAIATPQLETQVPVVADDVSEQITAQFQQRIQPTPQEPSIEVVEQQAAPTNEVSVDIQRDDYVQRDELTSIEPSEQDNQVPESAIATPQLETQVPVVADDVSEQITPNSPQMSQLTPEEQVFAVVDQQGAPTSKALIDVQRDELTSIERPEQDNQVPESAIATPQLETQVPVVADDVSEQITSDSQQIEQPAIEEESPEAVVQSPDVAEDVIESKTPEFIDKYIVLIAHDSKRSELAEIVAQHQKFFSKCLTLASSSISDLVAQQSGITISQQLPTATSGGYQTIASMVSSGDVLAVIFLRDLLMPQPGQANEEALLRLCNINNLLVATNPSTVKAIVHYLETAKR